MQEITENETTRKTTDGPHPSEYVKLVRFVLYNEGPPTSETVIGELYTLESRIAYGQIWPTKVRGKILDNEGDSVDFTLHLASGDLETDGDCSLDEWSVDAEDLERIQQAYGWRDASECYRRHLIAQGADYAAEVQS